MTATPLKQLPDLMAILAHDMRNPLAALLTNIHFVRSVVQGRGTDIEEALADSEMSCSILNQVVGNLDVIGRAFSDTLAPRGSLGTMQAANEAVARAISLARLADIELAIVPDQTGATIMTDSFFFGRALDNLLANALQYSPAKGKVTIGLATEADRAAVILTDRGPAIPLEFRELVLSAEGQPAAKKRYEARYGRGLGLYCASQAARMAGAEICLGEQDGRFLVGLWAPIDPRTP